MIPAEVKDPEVIKNLTEKHLGRYRKYLEYAIENPNQNRVNVTETTQLLKIWESIEQKNYTWGMFNVNERREVYEAYEDEEVPS